jgi:hypothetical protein
LESGFTITDAERNFKLDFQGFDVLIEQAIVDLLHIFRIPVQKRTHKPHEYELSGRVSNRWSSEKYHDLLKALGKNRSLHATLAKCDVRQALRKARELRNRWENNEEAEGHLSLRMHDLRGIVTEIMGWLETAYTIAEQEVEIPMGKQRETGQTGGVLECMGEPMDWEK